MQINKDMGGKAGLPIFLVVVSEGCLDSPFQKLPSHVACHDSKSYDIKTAYILLRGEQFVYKLKHNFHILSWVKYTSILRWRKKFLTFLSKTKKADVIHSLLRRLDEKTAYNWRRDNGEKESYI